ncbi:MAG: uracil-DNA glycosylase [Bacteroidota bacterium]
MHVKIPDSWKDLLKDELEKEYFSELIEFVENEYRTQTIFPPEEHIFSAFDYCGPDDLKVVILGQDPYHGRGQANGLCFSVSSGQKHPPSLKNIFKEIRSEYGGEIPISGDLSHWAEQGVLMLNATLTVREKQPGSHQKKGWETFTDSVIKLISDKKENVIFVLWGAFAQKKSNLIDSEKHLILESAHPSPFSVHRGFFGNNHFKKVNDYLKSIRKEEVNWQREEVYTLF